MPLKTGEDEDYMLALKQDLRGTMKKMPYFLAVEEDREGLFVCFLFLFICSVVTVLWRMMSWSTCVEDVFCTDNEE